MVLVAGPSPRIHVAALAAACEMRAWAWTADDRYLKSAVARMRRIVASVGDLRETDFFTPFPLAFACRNECPARALRLSGKTPLVAEPVEGKTTTIDCALESSAK